MHSPRTCCSLSAPARAARALRAAGMAWALAAWPAAGTAQQPVAPAVAPGALQPMAALDLPRYMGRWHELARYPNRFQRQCTGATTADYALLADGGVQVSNRCGLADGGTEQATGRARAVGPAGTARLQVRFAPAWLAWLPQVWGDYWVVDLDADYRVAIVSEPQREYLWVLSRTPQLDEAGWQRITARLLALGFDPARLQRAAAP
ncbi:lipocalin family protein [Aquabacterium sp. OR-4]|uniref:lipocalin family protein n=1 Tax=Aquabacterium sp. OR-4 TaxID=2978127 RepID=UPI0021B3C743|nr:lipocalin family protein [Aquabacterium sp. OR-4]MDT7837303.1 lipocalin family protein [Aquabacterium sp. OR-4]